MADHLLIGKLFLYVRNLLKSTQPGHPSMGRDNKYQQSPECTRSKHDAVVWQCKLASG